MSVTVYPCKCPEGHHLTDYPVEPVTTTKAHARWLIATKAFSYDEDGLHTREETHDSATWPPPDAEPTQPEGPPEGGSSDSGA